MQGRRLFFKAVVSITLSLGLSLDALPGQRPPAVHVQGALEGREAYDLLVGGELLGRVTESSAAVCIYPECPVDARIEYGTVPGFYEEETCLFADLPARTGADLAIDGLCPDTCYYYRLRIRRSGAGPFLKGLERTFHTCRKKGASFSFAVMADEHLFEDLFPPPSQQKMNNLALYRVALQNIARSGNDLLLSLGDFSCVENYKVGDSVDVEAAKERYLAQRLFLDEVAHSLCFYLVLGNHEGEQGWHYFLDDDSPSLAWFGLTARTQLIPNPFPDGFYDGNPDPAPDVGGFRENYYSWEWGDALFVVLDPFSYTMKKPHSVGGTPGTGNGWDWTLGKKQYGWLYETLAQSQARWKFVFIHHLVSTVVEGLVFSYYGRGGVEVAKFAKNSQPSFEWGGEDAQGDRVFEQERPGWEHGPIHDMLVSEGVQVVFHGHDHFFGRQDLDGIVYLECPKPNESTYDMGYKGQGKYKTGDFLPNSGHLQVSVGPERVKIQYIRAFLPGDGPNGDVAYSLTLNESDCARHR